MKHRKLLLIGCGLGVACVILSATLLLWPGRRQPLNDVSVTVCSASSSSSVSQSASSTAAQYMEGQVGRLTVEGTEISQLFLPGTQRQMAGSGGRKRHISRLSSPGSAAQRA